VNASMLQVHERTVTPVVTNLEPIQFDSASPAVQTKAHTPALEADWTTGLPVLKGRKATTNWFYQHRLADYGATFVPVRYHRDGKYVTAAGVSASIDMGLFLIAQIGGEALAKTIQLGVEYYPAPPFPERTPAEAPADAQALVRTFESSMGPALLALPPNFSGSFDVLPTHPPAERGGERRTA